MNTLNMGRPFSDADHVHLHGLMASGAGQVLAKSIEVSEYERESESVAASLSYLEERLQVLERRLSPVLVESAAGDGGAKQTSLPSSPIGAQLRGYSNRVESAASRISFLLNQLALP